MQGIYQCYSETRKHRKIRSKVFRVQRDISAENLTRTVNMRNTPQITFIVDQSIEYGVNISKKIDEVTRDLKDGAEE